MPRLCDLVKAGIPLLCIVPAADVVFRLEGSSQAECGAGSDIDSRMASLDS